MSVFFRFKVTLGKISSSDRRDRSTASVKDVGPGVLLQGLGVGPMVVGTGLGELLDGPQVIAVEL